MNIIIIDDHIQTLTSIRLALEARGFTCSTFSDPLLAVNRYAPEKYDLVISDINMPEMNGFQVKQSILTKNPEARIILITGDPDRISTVTTSMFDPYYFFTKPLDRFRFFSTIQNLESEIFDFKQPNKFYQAGFSPDQ